MTAVLLAHRTLIQIQGPDALSFLQGLTTNNVLALMPGHCVYTAFLNPQGKFLNDAFVIMVAENYVWLDVELEHVSILLQKLAIYKLRSQITLMHLPEILVYADISAESAAEPKESVIIIDPRTKSIGKRIYTKKPYTTALIAMNEYERLRISLCLPDGTRDIPYERGFILEYGFEKLNAIDFQKGCYIGQELTARMYYRNLGKRQLVCLECEGNAPVFGTEVKQNEIIVGTTRSHSGSLMLAHIKSEALENNEAFFIDEKIARIKNK
ncbi:MAG: hypothetical protein Q8S21_05170 [Candidatus Paracaedibacteraceae bacterium]|nr:hypothetical protein [Candidatus Paracaedibacteraceae bacterium]